MKRNDDMLLLYRIANYYYNENMSQNEIAYKEDVSRSQISRLLIKAREIGLVKISVELPDTLSTQDLEQKLELLLDLNRVIVVDTSLMESSKATEENIIKALTTAASNLLPELLADAQTIGVGWGRTLYNTSLLLPVTNPQKGRIFIPLVGNSGTQNSFLQTSSIVNRFAERFMAKAFYWNSPCVQRQDTLSSTYEDICLKQLNAYWEELDAAVIGLGTIPTSRNIYISELPKSAINPHLQTSCGEILGQTFDEKGDHDWISTNEYEFTGLTLDHLKIIDNVICLAGGIDKVVPIITAAKNGYMNTLITDDITANYILNKHS